jgi:hypothetical protein
LGFLNTGAPSKLTFQFTKDGEGGVLATNNRTAPIFMLVIDQWAIGTIAIVFVALFALKIVSLLLPGLPRPVSV